MSEATQTVAIRGGRVVLENDLVAADLLLKEERIAAILQPGEGPRADEEIDAAGKVVLPGGIDPHVHVWEPGAPDLEGFEAASKGAAAGGITTFIEMPLSNPPTVDPEAFALKRRLAEAASVVDFALWGGLLQGSLQHIPALTEAGAVAFKAFMNKPRIDYYDNLPDGPLLEAMRLVRQVGSLIGIHCENNELLAYNRDRLRAAGRRDYLSHAEWRPEICELDAVQRVILFSAEVGVRAHIVHLSSARAADLIRRARADGSAVTVETCPAYLLLDQTDLERLGPYANCDPPLRPWPNREHLWRHVEEGTIDLFASDHAPFSAEQKERGREDMWEAPMGIPGIQTMLPLLLDEALGRGIPLPTFARLSATATARIFGLYPQKGAIRVGADADLVIWDLDAPWQLNPRELFARHQWSPYEGRTTRVRVLRTLVRGRTVFADGAITARLGDGRLVRPAPSHGGDSPKGGATARTTT